MLSMKVDSVGKETTHRKLLKKESMFGQIKALKFTSFGPSSCRNPSKGSVLLLERLTKSRSGPIQIMKFDETLKTS